MTVNPDDENSYVVQIYSQEIIDDNISAKFQEDEEILKRSQSKKQLRIQVKYIKVAPPLCTCFVPTCDKGTYKPRVPTNISFSTNNSL